MHLTAGLHRSLQRHPDKLATVTGGRRQTFRQFADRVARLAGALRQLGLCPGDRVSLLAQNSDRFIETAMACWWSGLVLNPLNTRWSVGEVGYALQDCGARALLVDDALLPLARQLSAPALEHRIHLGDGAPPAGYLAYEGWLARGEPLEDARVDAASLAAILYTGGTTGFPKGVMLSHRNFWSSMVGRMAEVPNPADFVTLLTAPMFHVAGLGRMVGQAIVGGTCVTVPSFQSELVARILHEENVSDLVVVPSMLQALLDCPGFTPGCLPGLRRILWGAAPIALPLLERAMAAFQRVEFIHAYGMTETSGSVAVLRMERDTAFLGSGRIRSAGCAGLGAEIRIADTQGQEVPPGTHGEILVRGPMVMEGYWNRPDDTQKALVQGWLRTGDGGTMDEEGYVYVVDRIKDMVITGGENVYPAQVEEVLGRHPAVSHSAVIGIPHPHWGEAVHAVVVLCPGARLAESDLLAHCRQYLGGYQCPKSVEFRDSLPMTAAGKVQKSELRQSFWEPARHSVG